MPFRINFLATFAILLAFAGIAGPGRSFAQGDASWKERFLAEAPPAWEKYRVRAKRFQGSFERTNVRLAPKKEVIERSRCEIKQRDGCALFLAEGLGSGSPPDNVGLVMGINGQYGFELRRQTPTAPWAASQVVVDARDGMKFGFGTHPSEGVVYWSTCPTTFAMIPYADGVGIQDF